MKQEKTVLLAGNPNVGKSTLFNALTGMHQHTGNWTGKTVATAVGTYETKDARYRLVDIPGAYSLFTHSAEEEVARNALAFSRYDGVLVVCDATCLERNLALALQIAELSPRVAICVNLLDEAKKQHITVNVGALADALDCPAIGVSAHKRRTLSSVGATLSALTDAKEKAAAVIPYPAPIEDAVLSLSPLLSDAADALGVPVRWLSLRAIDGDASLRQELLRRLGEDLYADLRLQSVAATCLDRLRSLGYESIDEAVTAAIAKKAASVARAATQKEKKDARQSRLDRCFTGAAGYPFMILLLLLVIFLTVEGANLPSGLLADAFSWLGGLLREGATVIGMPPLLKGALLDGVYTVLTSVVAVMLPPMAIFFPLFTLLEDAGYLPRVAYNLDTPFAACGSCGKQALTMCMGFGCNAVGVDGCRIIDSPRERALAILTNAFVPCNGRFPALITVATLFFVGIGGIGGTLLSAGIVTALVVAGIAISLLVTRLLSATALRGVPSAFILEMPPYRRPRVLSVIVRSVFDRTLFVLLRAVSVAAPAGLIIWLLGYVTVGDRTLLQTIAAALDPVAAWLSLDGMILLAFLLGIVANEIVIPVVLMGYTAGGTLTEVASLDAIGRILAENGWTAWTAVAFLIFTVFHFPCATTLLTVRKETGKARYALAAAAIPTAVGVLLCLFLTSVRLLFF